MARELTWRRTILELADGAVSNGHIVRLLGLNPGETLARTHLSWLTWIDADFPTWAVGLATPVGLWLAPESATGADIPDPWLDSNADWIWWEAGLNVPRPTKGDVDASPNELDMASPPIGETRDIKAQRKADPTEGSALWFVSSSTGFAPTQTRHWLSVGVSAGILLPATAA